MEQDNKKRRTGQNIAFYTALAVCLIAVGVGTWELLQPEKTGNGASAVSSAVALPGAVGGGSAAGNGAAGDGSGVGPDGGDAFAAGGGTDGGAALPDGGAEIPTSGAAEITESASAADGGAAEAVSGSGAASVAKDAKANDEKSNAAKSDAKANDAKTGKADAKTSDAKSKDAKESGAKSSKDSAGKNAKADAKADKGKLSGEAVRPVEGETVTSFSMDKLLYNETMRDWRTHDGIDIAADAGTAVVSARAGTVESVTADPIMGCTVTVRHADKWESVYASLSDMTEVEAGDEVIAGQVIGFVGETAASESALGPHLHFSVLNDGVPVNPETFLA